MSDQFEMFDLTICAPIGKPISSPGSAAGRSRSASPGGLTIALCGPAPVPASPIPSRASSRATRTSATSGPYGSGSSASADLTRSLESRLRTRLDTDGLIEAQLIWRAKATQSGRRYFQLAVSARRIDATDCGLWPTPVAQDDQKSPEAHLAMKLRMGERDGTGANRTAITSLTVMAKASMWPTQTKACADGGQTSRSGARKGEMLLTGLAAASLWSTPRASDGEKGGPNQSFGAGGTPLPAQVAQTMWPTPTHRDHRSVLASPETHESNARPLSEVVGASLELWATPHSSSSTGPGTSGRQGGGNIQTQAHGAAQPGSSEQTARRGGLAPDFVAWLMMGNDLGAAVLACAPDKKAQPRFKRRRAKSSR